MNRDHIERVRTGRGLREVRVRGGTPRPRLDLAFELGRLHRSRDSWGPRGKLAVFQDSGLYRAYQAGYYGPYWWERTSGPWYTFHDQSVRIAYYRFLRAVYHLPAAEAWARVLQHVEDQKRR